MSIAQRRTKEEHPRDTVDFLTTRGELEGTKLSLDTMV